MIILAQYMIRKIPEEDRQIPGSVAGIVDSILTFLLVKFLLMVI